MKATKSLVKGVNDFICGDMSLIKFACGKSTSSAGNYMMPLLIAIAVWLAGIIAWFVFPISLVVAIPIVGILAVLFPPSLAIIGVIGIIILIIIIVANIVYFFYFFGKIGILALLPTAAWMAGFGISFLVGFIPIIGGMISFGVMLVVNLVPWMALATWLHQRIYASA